MLLVALDGVRYLEAVPETRAALTLTLYPARRERELEGQRVIAGFAIISQMIAITEAKAGKPLQNQARNRRW